MIKTSLAVVCLLITLFVAVVTLTGCRESGGEMRCLTRNPRNGQCTAWTYVDKT